ncbi:hypothetical protein RYX36_031282 [Vicia faba]
MNGGNLKKHRVLKDDNSLKWLNLPPEIWVGENSSEWICVRDLGDALFVLGKDSNFSLIVEDYHGFERSCIYFDCKGKTSCYNLKTSRLKIVDGIFGSCPTLFKCGNKN